MLSQSRGLTHDERPSELLLQHGWCSDAGLQGRNWERLDNLIRGLGLDNGHLAEDLPLAGLGGGLHAGLDAAQAGDGEDTLKDEDRSIATWLREGAPFGVEQEI